MANHSLKTLLEQKGSIPIVAPGAFDGLSARLVERAGFQACYASGGAIARSTGFPDLGLLSFTEVLDHMSEISRSTILPVIADGDTGFGNLCNVERTIQRFQEIGVSAVHLEDQAFPKRCGHLEGKTLISSTAMSDKVAVAKKTVSNQELLIIARTDAIAVEGFDAALNRAVEYEAAGADIIFVEAPETLEQIAQIAKTVKVPKLINMFSGGKTPLVPLQTLADMGYDIVIIPSDLQRASIHAMEKTLNCIKQHGNSEKITDELTSFKQREEIIGTERYLKLNQNG